MTPDLSVVVATRNRWTRLIPTLRSLLALPERPPVIVVDNGSRDHRAGEVRRTFPQVQLIEAGRNLGAAGRTVGVEAATTPLVAFCDDDSGWEPGSLGRAAEHLRAHPHLGLLAARLLVGEERRLDPVSAAMAASPLRSDRPLPGPPILGFTACAAVVRRQAYLDVGGFSSILFFLGEENLLAMDLAAAGWDLAYAPDVVALHDPAHRGVDPSRQALARRNDVLTLWMRRSLRRAEQATRRLTEEARHDPVARAALAGVLDRLPRALAARRSLPDPVEQQLRLLE